MSALLTLNELCIFQLVGLADPKLQTLHPKSLNPKLFQSQGFEESGFQSSGFGVQGLRHGKQAWVEGRGVAFMAKLASGPEIHLLK